MSNSTPGCSGDLSRPPPNNAGKAARKKSLNRHYVHLAVDEIFRLKGKEGLEYGMHLIFTQEGGFFSTPATTSETRLLNPQNFDRSEAAQAQTKLSNSNIDYKVDISLVPPQPLPKNGYKVDHLKGIYIKAMSSTIRNVKKREVRENNAKQMARAEVRKASGYVENASERQKKENNEYRAEMSGTKTSDEKQALETLAKPPQERKKIDRSRPGWETAEKRQEDRIGKDRKARRRAEKLLGRYGKLNVRGQERQDGIQ
ncbi:hypothetical protein SBOR_0850 [Sclerotinia borealis F-4128]|uniref:Uncharacterized protein n=1 Tax=Sclerotinia borealis (strain F-4128) TaxID=1432307 RepID=W9CVV4_SCLBF|nr:hypothetical protein SBOR_0850 [Sclerotinia borealis F-4128]